MYVSWIDPTWNEIFASVAPLMIHEARDQDVRAAIERFLTERASRALTT
jgi:hypothetical protein